MARILVDVRRVVLVSCIIALLAVSMPTAYGTRGESSAWSQTSSYPLSVYLHDCVIESSLIYCVGGYNGTTDVDSVYHAQIASGGIGVWTQTTSYPVPIDSERCVTDSGYIYCIGGGQNGAFSDLVYYTQLSQAGISSWSLTTSYPIKAWGTGCACMSP